MIASIVSVSNIFCYNHCIQLSTESIFLMPALIRVLTPVGLQDAPYQADSLAEAAQYEPADGVYTVANTFNTYDTLKLDAHFDRLEDSARRQSIPLNLNRQAIRAALRQMIDEAGFGSVRFRVTVGRKHPDRCILTIEKFIPPSEEIITHGVCCITVPDRARKAAEAKTTGWMHARKKLAEAMPQGIYETFLLDSDGYLLEGLGANFYAIIHGELRTAGEGVLKGIAQQIVFEIAPQIIPVRAEAVHVRNIAAFEEAFLTSSSRGIIPVVEIDHIAIGAAKRGAITQRLQEAYKMWLQAHLQPL